MEYREFITKILSESKKIANKNFGKVEGVTKSEDNNQVLTKTDIEIANYIIGQIKQQYPQDNIIDEELGVLNNNSEKTWVIDPMDGTANFAQSIPLYGIMVGLLCNNQPIVGGIILPEFNQTCIAEKGKGVECNGKKIGVTKKGSLLSALVSCSVDSHQENPQLTQREAILLGKIILKIRSLRMGGSAFDVVMVAQGKYDGYFNQTSKIWDNAAQQIVIEEAGGIYSDFFGNPIDYSKALTEPNRNYTCCAAPPTLHKQLQKIIQQTT